MTKLATQPPLSAECISDLIFDAIIAGDRAREQHDDHIGVCPRCRERLDALGANDVGNAPVVDMLIARAAERAKAPAPRAAKRKRRWFYGIASAFTVAASAAALFIALPTGDGDRTKGTAMSFYVQRQGEVRRGVSGPGYRAGDALRFALSSQREGYFLLVGIQEDGEVVAYHPFQGEASAPHGAGTEVPLPGSLILDDQPGTEYYLGIFSSSPVSTEEVRRSVEELRRERGARGTLSETMLHSLELPGTHHLVVIGR